MRHPRAKPRRSAEDAKGGSGSKGLISIPVQSGIPLAVDPDYSSEIGEFEI